MDETSGERPDQAMSSGTIPIFELAEPASEWVPETGGQLRGLGERPSRARWIRERTTRVVEVSVQTLSENMASFVEGVATMLATGTRTAGAYEVDSVEIECQISGSGRIGFVGTGVDVQGSSTIRMIFKRKAGAPAND